MVVRKKVLRIISNILSFIILSLSSIILCASYYIAKYLKEINFYEIEYLLKSSSTGINYSIVYNAIKICIPLFIIVLILIYLPITNSKKKSINIVLKKSKKNISLYPNIFNTYKIAYALLILSISIVIILNVVSFSEYVDTKNSTTEIYDKYYIDSNDVKIEFKEKRNLILILAESTESSLFSKTNGGTFNISRSPELENLALKNTNFSNTEKIGGGLQISSLYFTVSGTIAATSGVPLEWQLEEGQFNKNIKTMGNILEKEGYNLEHIQGSDIKFADTDKYFKVHGNYYLYDLIEARNQKFIPNNYYVHWGFEDKKLFEISKQEITKLAESKKPFAVSISTMDTHFVDGYLDETCETPFKDQMSNVFACNSKMIYDFVEWAKEQDFYENTTIVIIGDHLSKQGSYYEDYPNYERTTYNVFINSAKKEKNSKNREFTNFDMFPTILASMGAEIEGNQLGFGVNLYSGKETMIEILGKDIFETELLKKNESFLLDAVYKRTENKDTKK